MPTYSGEDKHIQRKVRRAYDYLVKTRPEIFSFLPGENLSFIFKAIFIALDEDHKDSITVVVNKMDYGLGPGTVTHNITLDTDTASTLNPIPFDPEV